MSCVQKEVCTDSDGKYSVKDLPKDDKEGVVKDTPAPEGAENPTEESGAVVPKAKSPEGETPGESERDLAQNGGKRRRRRRKTRKSRRKSKSRKSKRRKSRKSRKRKSRKTKRRRSRK